MSREVLVEQWLANRSEANGFRILSATVLDVGSVELRRSTRGGSTSPVTFGVATITGALEVSNTDLLRGALIDGIGPQKAFGCGLMLIRRRRNADG